MATSSVPSSPTTSRWHAISISGSPVRRFPSGWTSSPAAWSSWWGASRRRRCCSGSPGGRRSCSRRRGRRRTGCCARAGCGVTATPTRFGPAQRHADYAYRLAVDAPAAKELRLFGLAPWVVERFAARRRKLYELQWRATRFARASGAAQSALVLALRQVEHNPIQFRRSCATDTTSGCWGGLLARNPAWVSSMSLLGGSLSSHPGAT